MLKIVSRSFSTSAKGRAYAWGDALGGALGVPALVLPKTGHPQIASQKYPRVVRHFQTKRISVSDVGVGYGFSFFVTSKGNVFGTGMNTNSQLGLQNSASGKPLAVVLSPSPIGLPVKPGTKVLQATGGRAHSVFVTDREGVMTCGNNAFGQCGRQVVENESYEGVNNFHQVRGIDGNVIQVAVGLDHTLFLTDKGQVWACGWGSDGQLGSGDTKSISQPRKIDGALKGVKVVNISSKAETSLAVSDDGGVFGWGNGEYSQLASVGDKSQLNEPHELKFGSSVGSVVQVVAGGTNCGLLNSDGQVHTWGFGILGKGPLLETAKTPQRLPQNLFGSDLMMKLKMTKESTDPDTKVIQLETGLNSFAAVTDSGFLFTWGKNKNGCLGLWHGIDQYFPFKVSVPAQVKKIAFGVRHAVCLATPWTS